MSPVIEMEVVDRPISARGKWCLDQEIKALLTTAESGQAVRLDVSDQVAIHKVHMAMRHAASKRGYTFRYKKTAHHTLVAWVDKRR